VSWLWLCSTLHSGLSFYFFFTHSGPIAGSVDPMSAPTSKFSKLSLGGMAPTTRSKSQKEAEGPLGEVQSSTEVDTESDSSLDDETPAVVRSPTKLSYKIDKLSPQAQSRVREAFKDPPKLALQYCRLRDDVYAFQMTEMVPRSIRIGSPGSNFPLPKCSCGKQDNGPCKHLLWLLDQLTKQINYDNEPGASLTMRPEGYAEEFGDPHSNISHFHLDVVAEGLHCEVIHPGSDDEDEDDLEPNRVRESRELLAAVAGQEPESFRPDIFSAPMLGKNIIKRNDLECTIFRMLLDNDDFYHYFISQARPSDPVKDPFRKLEQRVDRVLRELDTYSATASATGSSSSSPTNKNSPTSHGPEGPRNVAWAAFHIQGAAKLIRATIFRRDRPLAAWERTSAARALVRILASVVERNRDAHPGPTILDRNLYARLIGNANDDFVIGTLLLLPDATAPFLQDLEVVSDGVGVNGAPALFVEKFGRLLARLKKPAVGGGEGAAGSVARSGSKRQARQASPDRGSKRMK